MGLRDPRLWSNLRGVIGGEGASARVAAYSRISCREGMTVTEAWAEGFTRHGTAPGLLEWTMLVPFLAVALAFLVGWVFAGRRRAPVRSSPE